VITNLLLEKLIQLERSIGVETETTLRRQVIDAQDCVLAMQKEIAENFRKESRRVVFEPYSSSSFAA
jgi:hypothetical protein